MSEMYGNTRSGTEDITWNDKGLVGPVHRTKEEKRGGRKDDKGMHGKITSLYTCPDAQRRLSGVGVFYVDPVFAGRRDIAAAFAV